jgi:hypothetical protein
MTDHHPDAETVLAEANLASHIHDSAEWGRSVVMHTNEEAVQRALDALSAAGLAVVRVGDVPPWMERATYSDGEPVSLYDPGHPSGRPLYVIKEQS